MCPLTESTATIRHAFYMVSEVGWLAYISKALSERLQFDPELTLEKAKKIVRQREAVQEQQQILKNNTSLKEERLVDSLGHTNPYRGKGTSIRRPPKGARQHQQKPPPAAAGTNCRCSRCGKGPHARHLCPAKDVECYTCKQKGHFSSQCFSKSVADVSSNETPTDNYYDTAFLDTIGAGNATTWNSTILIDGHDVPF